MPCSWLAAAVLASCGPRAARLYVGSYADLRAYDAGSLAPVAATAEVPAPSFLTAHPWAPVLYAVSEVAEGSVSALAAGQLRLLAQERSGGGAPCHLAVSPDGRYLLCANYGGRLTVFPIDGDATLAGRPTDTASHVHPHHCSWQRGEATVVDLGADALYGYAIEDGRLRRTWVAPAEPGAGPRQLAIHPAGYHYVADELSSTVSTYLRQPGGGLELAATVPATLVAPADRNYPAEIAVSGDGRFVYLANRGNDTITTFAVGPAGRLRAVDEVPTGGVWPRHFTIAGPVMYVANQRSGTVTVLRLHDGVPRPTSAVIETASPSCVLVV
jgi:6-phosphogluconolactonase (cycloisomerase 2 family)